MNDTELDELLDTSSAPPAPASLRENVRAGFAAGLKRNTSPSVLHWITAFVPGARKRLLAAAVLGVGAFLLIVTQAFPQMFGLGAPPVKIPYTVDSEFVRYADDGSSTVDMYSTSYGLNGHEILLSRSFPGNPFGTVIGRTADATLPLLSRLISRLTIPAEELERVRQHSPHTIGAVTGCDDWTCLLLEHYFFQRVAAGIGAGCLDGAVVGRETILSYPTAAVQLALGDQRRMTWWTAPDLGCFALRIMIEEKRPDGTFRLVSKKQALKVTLNP
jgi:hypothetical protein